MARRGSAPGGKIVLETDAVLAGNAPAAVERLMLSALGAGIKLYGSWDTALDLAEWRQVSTLGRDQFVKIALKGYLFPLGHKAVEITTMAATSAWARP